MVQKHGVQTVFAVTITKIEKHKNKLFKCAPIANILDMGKGDLYDYKGVSANGDVQSLVKQINKPESICSMCPEQTSHSVDHFKKENVHVKNID